MTDWVDIANSAVAPKAPVTSELMNALRDNTITTMWENVSVIYDWTIDGSVNSVETPLLEDGWDYGLLFSGLQGGDLAANLRFEIQQSSDSTWNTLLLYGLDDPTGTLSAFSLAQDTTTATLDGDIYVLATRLDRPTLGNVVAKTIGGLSRYGSSGDQDKNSAAGGLAGPCHGKVDKMRIRCQDAADVISRGTITLRRKRNQTYA